MALLALQRTSYANEAELIGDDRIPPLQEDLVSLTAWRGRWITAWNEVDLVGAVAWVEYPEKVEIDKLMVSPSATRQGIATALLDQVITRSAGRPLLVATGRDNVPAVALYSQRGFTREADEQVPPGIWLSRFRLTA